MEESDAGITEESRALCQTLQALPLDTLFRDDIIRKTCQKLEDRNETRVIREIAQLIVPSVESLATFDATRLAFTEDQRKRLKPFHLTDTSLFVATWRMWFPFFTCEVKCGAGALDVADRQNAHSATLAVRGVVELFSFSTIESSEFSRVSRSHSKYLVQRGKVQKAKARRAMKVRTRA
jgi:hypothetical protein